MSGLMETIKARKSVRTFDGKPLTEEHRKDLEAYVQDLPNPFDIPVRFVFMDAAKEGLSSPVLTGEPMYLAGIVKKSPYADVAFGYSFEKLVLHAQDLGIGTVFIGGTMKRELFEAAAGLQEGEMMPCMSPLGYPAKKRSLKEGMMRKGIGADSRKDASELFFDGDFGTPLHASEDMARVLEMVRWAPSAVNKQPWRIVYRDGVYHFYEKHDKGYLDERVGDMQKVDMGIALCHFVMGLEEQGKRFECCVCDPGLALPADTEYIASVKVL